jgi:DNA-binding GntR family transcriptional regulator
MLLLVDNTQSQKDKEVELMVSRKIDNHSLSNLIKEAIVEDIILGKLNIGDKLVEAKYAEEFGISRAPVREAFSTLTLEGIVQKIPRKETVVKGYTPEELWDLLNIRKYLENLALERLDMNALKNLAGDMERIIIDMELQTDIRRYTQLNHDFHHLIITASNSDIIKNMYNQLGTVLLSLHTVALMNTKNLKRSLSEHKQVVNSLKSGNIDEARIALKKHNDWIFSYVDEIIKK